MGEIMRIAATLAEASPAASVANQMRRNQWAKELCIINSCFHLPPSQPAAGFHRAAARCWRNCFCTGPNHFSRCRAGRRLNRLPLQSTLLSRDARIRPFPAIAKTDSYPSMAQASRGAGSFAGSAPASPPVSSRRAVASRTRLANLAEECRKAIMRAFSIRMNALLTPPEYRQIPEEIRQPKLPGKFSCNKPPPSALGT
jgi:hypothetical protein